MITFVIGGSRSGKSAVAERLAARAAGGGRVTYVATIGATGGDEDLADRLARHRDRRPAHWSTVEPPYDLAEVLRSTAQVVLVDSLGPWVSLHPDLEVDPAPVLAALRSRTHPTVLVSDEVGWGVHPPTELGRRFRDAVGTLNQHLAAAADETLLVVAGRVVRTSEAP